MLITGVGIALATWNGRRPEPDTSSPSLRGPLGDAPVRLADERITPPDAPASESRVEAPARDRALAPTSAAGSKPADHLRLDLRIRADGRPLDGALAYTDVDLHRTATSSGGQAVLILSPAEAGSLDAITVTHPAYVARTLRTRIDAREIRAGAATREIDLERGAEICCRFRDEDGLPVEGVRLTALPDEHADADGILPIEAEALETILRRRNVSGIAEAAAVSDATGSACLHLPLGSFAVSGRAAGLLPFQGRIAVESDALHEVVLRRGVQARGRVRSAAGPVAAAQVIVFDHVRLHAASTDADGAFAIGGLGDASTFHAVVVHPDHPTTWFGSVPAHAFADLVVEAGRSVEVVLLDASTGAHIQAAECTVRKLGDFHLSGRGLLKRYDGGSTTTVLEGGTLTLSKLGSHVEALEVDVAGYVPEVVPLELGHGQERIICALRPIAVATRIVVRDAASGTALAGASVRLRATRPAPSGTFATGHASTALAETRPGEYEITNDLFGPQDEVVVIVSKQGYRSPEGPVRIRQAGLPIEPIVTIALRPL